MAQLERCRFLETKSTEIQLDRCAVIKCEAAETSFQKADVSGCIFHETNLERASFEVGEADGHCLRQLQIGGGDVLWRGR